MAQSPSPDRRPSPSVPLGSFPDRNRPGPSLPVPLTSFVGRAREVTQVATLLRRPDVRLVTLTGPGGVGKTRLALHVAGMLAAEFADGVIFVDLSSIADPTVVLPTIARTLGIQNVGDRPLADVLPAYLRPRKLLLLLDNFEQVVEAAPLLADLLTAVPHQKILTTSRAVLRLSGEHVFLVPPLTLPGSTPGRDVEDLAASEAVQLFVGRARSARADFAFSQANAPAIAEICARLDGLPLAIELAAARVPLFAPTALLARLERRLPVLSGGPRDAPARLRTMRDAIAWSYDLLSLEEQALFRRLAVFVGGFTLEAAEQIAGAGGPDLDVLDGISTLLGESLLRQDERVEGEPRFGMLETIREFGLEQLAATGEEDSIQRRHAEYFLELVERAEPALFGPEQVRWLDCLESDLANLRAVIAWSLACDECEIGLRLAAGLWQLGRARGHMSETRGWLARLLERHDAIPPAVLTKALAVASDFAQDQGDYQEATELGEAALAVARRSGDRLGAARALYALAGNEKNQGRLDRAAELFEEALDIFRVEDDKAWIAQVLLYLGDTVDRQGNHERAAALLEGSLRLMRELGHIWGIAWTLEYLADLACNRADFVRAANLVGEGLALHRELNDDWGIVSCFSTLATIAAAWNQYDRAARLLGVREAMRETLGLPPVFPQHRTWYDPLIAGARRALGDVAFAAAWAAGRAMSLDAAAAEAFLVAPPTSPPASDPARGTGLTPRELEVLRLVVAGKSNPEIGEALFISHRTVQTHVTNIFAKLGVASRAEATAVAVRDGLV